MVKTPTTTPLATTPANPWHNINWKNTIASCDASVITPAYCSLKGKIHGGYNWWQERTKTLRCQICPKPLNLFVLEFFPYHTKNAFSFPSHLPSNEYRNWLLCQAMNDNKLIVVLRGEKRWFGIKDKCCDGQPLGEKLLAYKEAEKVIIHQNPQSVYLTEKNFEPNDWEKLIAALEFGNK